VSSPFTDHGPVRLQVATGSDLAEVFVVDREFALVERAIGKLDRTIPQGVYKIKARVGDVATEGWHVVNADQYIDLSHELAIGSPVPLAGTTKTHEYHMYPAEEQSRKVIQTVGSGAGIYLCARRWSDVAPAPDPVQTDAPPLSLHRPDGTTIIDVRENESDRGDGDPMLGAAVEVDPGAYLVRWRAASGALAEQTVVAVQGWQTQVFLLETQDRDIEGVPLQAPLEGVSVLMSRGGFTANDESQRIAEHARAALASERRVASQVISESLFAKFDNPMTGLFGAHLMLLAHDTERQVEKEASRGADAAETKRVWAPVTFDQTLFDIAVDNLAGLLGPEHPDVTALATRSGNRQLRDLAPVEMPPMLWRSWVLLIEASNEQPGLVPVATWERTVRLLPVRPFLVWSPVDDAATVAAWKHDLAPLVQASASQQQGGGPAGGSAMAAPASAAPAGDDARRLTQQLLAPRAALDELAGGDLPD
jgi:hypothetical protein